MPKYDYKCPECETVEERLHPMDYEGPVVCTDCFVQMNKLIAPTAVRFKGQGWGGVYRTYKPKKDS